MKIQPINTNNYSFKSSLQSKTNHKIVVDKKVSAIVGSSVGAILAGVAIYAHRNNYINTLARDLSKELNKKVTAKDLSSVMTKEEMLREIPKLTEQNYVASAKNIENGTFLADLHSHSNYSDGQITVENLLNQAVEYGNRLNKINGKKFIFTLSDHDGIDGVKEALKLIAKEPQKYKNVKFVPASEMSFAIPCDKNSSRFKRYNSDVQVAELLVYDINPFSKETEKFFSNIYNKRTRQIEIAIEEANKLKGENIFSAEEYKNYYTNPDKKPFFYNQHWRLFNYLQTKNRASDMAKEMNQDADKLYNNLLYKLHQQKSHFTPYELDKYIKTNEIKTNTEYLNSNITKKLEETIFPKKLNETTVNANFENSFDEIIQYAEKENAVLAFAHPAFTMENFSKDKILDGMKTLIKKSNGKIKFAEKYHQAYPYGKTIEKTEVDFYNKVLDELNLIPLGGRDNHKPKLL